MSRLKWIRVEKFRNVVPGTRLELNDGLNVLLGKNGTGKSNLLHLISMASRLDFSALAEEAFLVEFGVEEPKWQTTFRYDHRVAGDSSGFGPDRSEAQWELLLLIRATSHHGDSVVVEASPTGGLAKVNGGESTSLRPVQFHLSRQSTAALWASAVSGREVVAGAPAWLDSPGSYRFDEQLLVFEAIHGRGEPFLSSPPPSVVEVRKWIGGERKGTTAIWSNFVPARLGNSLVQEGEEQSPELSAWLAPALGLERVTWEARLQRRSTAEGFEQRSSFGEFELGCHESTNAYLLADRLSYGEKRLLSFAYYLEDSRSLVIADELANGLHYDWIRLALEKIGDRQAFLTSQNSLLLDFLPIGSEEEATRMFVRCEHAEDRKWRWVNFSAEEGKEFYRELSVGVEHVSEILRTRGLW